MIPYGNKIVINIMNIFNTADLGQLIKNARRQQGLTQNDLAGMAGTNRRFISELEKGKETAEIGKAIHVLSVLGLALSVHGHWSK